MKVAVVFEIKEGTAPERAQNLALGIATMVNAAVRGEPDVEVDIDPKFEIPPSIGIYEYKMPNCLKPLASLLEKKQ